ncbi:hypothetical protein GOODEAATRI_015310, partial [Goodea atripinnis]
IILPDSWLFLSDSTSSSIHRGKPAYVIMVNLAFSDGSFSLTLPLRLAYYMNKGRWYFPDWICRLCVFGFYVNLYSR